MSSADTFAEKAPLLEDVALAKIVLIDLLAPEVRRHVDTVSVYGSFADPDRALDRDGTVSDLDVYVTLDDAALPRVGGEPIEVSTRFTATHHGQLCRCATHGALEVYGQREAFDVPLPDASVALWASIECAERAVFHATELDAELLRLRPLDLTLGTPGAFEAFLGDDPHLEVWPRDE